MMWITWSLALSDEKTLLGSVSDRILTRKERAISDARHVFGELAATTTEPCSEAHLNLMRSLVLNTRTVEEVGFFDNGRLACTSWGLIDRTFTSREPDFITREGIGVTLNIRPALPGGTPKLALSFGSYNVLVDPLRLVDVLAEPQIEMAISASSGLNVARTDDVTDAQLAAFAMEDGAGIQGNYIYSLAQSGDWVAIAFERRPSFFSTLRREQLLLLPIGLFLAGLIVSLVFWQFRQRLSLKAEIAAAIRHQEFHVQYQPIIEIASGRCVGAEALVRWRREDGSFVRPDLFIPVAEDNGLIGEITALVIARVASDMGAVLAADPSLHVSINLAPDDLKTDAILLKLNSAILGHGIDPGQIWLEVTERGLMDYDTASEIIDRMRNAGYRLSIDDFGTGYSSLQHLQQIKFDTLKIDKSFVDTIAIDSAKSTVIFHIIEMAKALGVSIIAEGVERQEQADYLRSNGVTLAQGWLYSRAMPADEFKASLEGQSWQTPR